MSDFKVAKYRYATVILLPLIQTFTSLPVSADELDKYHISKNRGQIYLVPSCATMNPKPAPAAILTSNARSAIFCSANART